MKRSVVAKTLLAVLWLTLPCAGYAQPADTRLQTPDTTYGIISSGNIKVTPTGGQQQTLANALGAITITIPSAPLLSGDGVSLGAVTAIANVPISGSTGSFTTGGFSGTATLSGGGTIAGTFTGNVAWSGAQAYNNTATFNGPTTFNSSNVVGNGHSFNFADASGNNARFIAASNSFQFSGTNSAGALISTFSFPLHVDTPVWTWQVPLIVNTPTLTWSGSTASNGFWTTQAVTGTTTATSPFMNRFDISSDTIDGSGLSATPITGLSVNHNFGGTTTKGGRTAINAQLVQSGGALADTGADHFFVGGSFYTFNRFSPPGATASAPLGRIFGFNAFGQIQAGFTANNYYQVAGGEVNVSISSGSTAAIRTGLTIADLGGAAQGFWGDNMIWLYSTGTNGPNSGPAGFRYGMAFGDTQPWPMDPTAGTMIGAKMSSPNQAANPFATKWGMDLVQVTLPSTGNPYDGGFLRSNGYSVDGKGTVQQGSCYTSTSTTGETIDCKGSIGTSAAISAAGSGYPAIADMAVTTAYGGLWAITTNGSGVPVSLVQLSAPAYPSSTTPSNPVATINQVPSSAGTGLTLTITWNTTATTLSLNPTGGLVAIGKNTTVAALPTCNTAADGSWSRVSDATSPTYNGALTGGGAVHVPVYCNGTAWTSH